MQGDLYQRIGCLGYMISKKNWQVLSNLDKVQVAYTEKEVANGQEFTGTYRLISPIDIISIFVEPNFQIKIERIKKSHIVTTVKELVVPIIMGTPGNPQTNKIEVLLSNGEKYEFVRPDRNQVQIEDINQFEIFAKDLD